VIAAMLASSPIQESNTQDEEVQGQLQGARRLNAEMSNIVTRNREGRKQIPRSDVIVYKTLPSPFFPFFFILQQATRQCKDGYITHVRPLPSTRTGIYNGLMVYGGEIGLSLKATMRNSEARSRV
jgi:hypothetical protein